MVSEEIKTKKKQCKHKFDKDRSRKNSSSKRIDSNDLYYKSKSDRFFFSNQNLNYNQDKMYRSSYNDDRYYKSYYYHKRNVNYAYDYRYKQQASISTKRGEKSRSRSDRDTDLRFDQQKTLEATKSNLSKIIKQNELPHEFDAKREHVKHLYEVSDKKSIQNFTQFCKTITQQESQSNSSFGEAECDLNSDSDEIRSNNSSDRLQNYWTNSPLKELHKSKHSIDDDKSKVKKEYQSPFSTQSLNSTKIKQPFDVSKEPNCSSNSNLNQIFTRIHQEVQRELLQQFPVSSGNDHRIQEKDWFPSDHKPSLSLSVKNKIIHCVKKGDILGYNHCDSNYSEGLQFSKNNNEHNPQQFNLMTRYYEEINSALACPQSNDSQQTVFIHPFDCSSINTIHFFEY